MLKTFQPASRLTLSGSALFITGSIFFGITAGIAAYFISLVIYIPIIFPFIFGVLVSVACNILLKASKIHQKQLIILTGLLTAFLILLAFHVTSYQHDRRQFIRELRENYILKPWQAEEAVNQILQEETGYGGFIGYMLLIAQEENTHGGYLVMYSLPVYEFNFSIKGLWFWVYTFFEFLFYAFPIIFFAREARPTLTKVPTTGMAGRNKSPQSLWNSGEQLLVQFSEGRLLEICQFTYPGENLTHPILEIYIQQSRDKNSDVLLLVQETFLDPNKLVRRKLLGMWEAPRDLYNTFLEKIKNNQPE